jgi:hypothetical protein
MKLEAWKQCMAANSCNKAWGLKSIYGSNQLQSAVESEAWALEAARQPIAAIDLEPHNGKKWQSHEFMLRAGSFKLRQK